MYTDGQNANNRAKNGQKPSKKPVFSSPSSCPYGFGLRCCATFEAWPEMLRNISGQAPKSCATYLAWLCYILGLKCCIKNQARPGMLGNRWSLAWLHQTKPNQTTSRLCYLLTRYPAQHDVCHWGLCHWGQQLEHQGPKCCWWGVQAEGELKQAQNGPWHSCRLAPSATAHPEEQAASAGMDRCASHKGTLGIPLYELKLHTF